MASVIVRFLSIFFVLFSVSTFAQRKSSSTAPKKTSEDYKMLAYRSAQPIPILDCLEESWYVIRVLSAQKKDILYIAT